ncbi:MAG: FxDxF family PEP-CTERM protein [Burkholderiales bacterium]|nr:FxDxF family PEP-CTERM protein [Burkholderiales bacterium]
MKLNIALAASTAVLATASFAAGPGYLGELDNTSIDIGNTHGSRSTPFNGAFTDVYTFDLVDPGLIKGGLHSTAGLPFGIKNFNATISGGSLITPEVFERDERTYAINFFLDNLTSGHYTLTVTGSVFGGKGSYGGDISAVTAPVPEPESLALALAGVGVIVSLSSRRRTQA